MSRVQNVLLKPSSTFIVRFYFLLSQAIQMSLLCTDKLFAALAKEKRGFSSTVHIWLWISFVRNCLKKLEIKFLIRKVIYFRPYLF